MCHYYCIHYSWDGTLTFLNSFSTVLNNNYYDVEYDDLPICKSRAIYMEVIQDNWEAFTTHTKKQLMLHFDY